MDWDYIRIESAILALVALGAALAWGIGYAVYLNRIGSRGWASTRRLLSTATLVFVIILPLALAIREGETLWTLARVRFGSPEGHYQLGMLYSVGGTFLRVDSSNAAIEFRHAAELGHIKGQFALAQICRSGQGTPKDITKALHWARIAAHAGHPLAMVLTGELLQESSPLEAESYFREAVPLLQANGVAGDGQACFTLGYLHRNGLGVDQDPVQALSWMLLARRLKIGPLQGLVVQMYEKSLTPNQQIEARRRAEALILTKPNR